MRPTMYLSFRCPGCHRDGRGNIRVREKTGGDMSGLAKMTGWGFVREGDLFVILFCKSRQNSRDFLKKRVRYQHKLDLQTLCLKWSSRKYISFVFHSLLCDPDPGLPRVISLSGINVSTERLN